MAINGSPSAFGRVASAAKPARPVWSGCGHPSSLGLTEKLSSTCDLWKYESVTANVQGPITKAQRMIKSSNLKRRSQFVIWGLFGHWSFDIGTCLIKMGARALARFKMGSSIGIRLVLVNRTLKRRERRAPLASCISPPAP